MFLRVLVIVLLSSLAQAKPQYGTVTVSKVINVYDSNNQNLSPFDKIASILFK
jgi:hypothetical protein